jgi:hypothetical protein
VSGKVFYRANVAHFFKIKQGISALMTTFLESEKKINPPANCGCHVTDSFN